jgi:hypothetical protein
MFPCIYKLRGSPGADDFTGSKTAGYQIIASPYIGGNVSWTGVRKDSANSAPGLGRVVYAWKGSRDLPRRRCYGFSAFK